MSTDRVASSAAFAWPGLIFAVALFIAACGGGGGEDPTTHGWSTAALFESAGGSAGFAKVVVDGSDNATLVWVQSDGTHDRIYARRYSAAGTLGAVVALSANTVDAMEPQVGLDGDGNVFVVWAQTDNSIQSRIHAAASGAWSAVQPQVSGLPSVPNLSFAVDVVGNATVAWYQHGSGEYYNFACRFTASNACAVATTDELEHNSGGTLYAPEVAAGPGGKAMAVWATYSSTATLIRASYFDGTTWSGAVDISAAGKDAQSPRVAFDGDGNAMVVWEQKDGDELAAVPYHIHARRFVEAGLSWEAAETLDPSASGSAEDARIVFDTDGNASAVWAVETGGDHPRIRFSRYSPGAGWSGLSYIDDAAGADYCPVLSVDASGNITVVWDHDDDTYVTVAANRYEPATGWRGMEIISEPDINYDADDISVASDSQGRAIAVWDLQDFAVSHANGWFSVYR